MSAAKLLDRLDRPKQTRPGLYVAGCPCCGSRRGRPISIRELDDGRILLHAFCGCETQDVLSTLGLAMSDLFPARLAGAGPAGGSAPSHSRIPARDLIEILDHETTVAVLILADVLKERTASEEQWARLARAASLIGKARDHGRA